MKNIKRTDHIHIENGSLKKTDIYEAVKHAFPNVLTEEKQYKKLSNLLQKIKKKEKWMFVAVRFTQNGSLSGRFSQENQLLVKELVNKKWL